MANGQITIHQSHLPHHFFVSVPVDLAGSSYENATEMAYIVLTKSRKGYVSWKIEIRLSIAVAASDATSLGSLMTSGGTLWFNLKLVWEIARCVVRNLRFSIKHRLVNSRLNGWARY